MNVLERHSGPKRINVSESLKKRKIRPDTVGIDVLSIKRGVAVYLRRRKFDDEGCDNLFLRLHVPYPWTTKVANLFTRRIWRSPRRRFKFDI